MEIAERPAMPVTGHPSTPRLTKTRLADGSLRHRLLASGSSAMVLRARDSWFFYRLKSASKRRLLRRALEFHWAKDEV